jgi:hypothetical protein
MATRTIKLMGKAYSTSGDVSVVVNFNSTEVFNGTVTTVNSAYVSGETPVELASWTVDTSITGDIPLTIAVSGGSLAFTNLHGNYSGYVLQETDGVLDVVDGAYVVLTDVDAYFGEVNENSSATDGKTNITFSSVDGDAQTRTLANADDYGDWTYRIDDGITFGCDFALDSSLVILTVPTP